MKKLLYKGDACIIESPSNLFYFTRYQSADAILVFYKGKSYYFTDSRYFEEVSFMSPETEILNVATFDDFIRDNSIKSASVESSVNVKEYLRFQKAGIEEFFFIDEDVAKLRSIKDADEIELMKKAQNITDNAFSAVLGDIKGGMTERELASCLESHLFGLGGDGLAFDSIVAFGANTSKPHAHRGETVLEKGMAITMDFGAKFGGYSSDMTRTVFFGTPSDKILDTYKKVAEAQNLAINTVKAGMTGKECDYVARGYFEKFGLDKYFIHSLGHSLGIDCHENPNFSPRCEAVIEKGMTLSVEPGLYFAGEFGIRIEDVIYFSENGVINLTKSPKNIIIL